MTSAISRRLLKVCPELKETTEKLLKLSACLASDNLNLLCLTKYMLRLSSAS